jgi:hypothetical protein
MHSYWNGYVVLDWQWGWFLFWLLVAALFCSWAIRYNKTKPLGILAVLFVIYQGVHWALWDWAAWLFVVMCAGLWILLIAAIIHFVVGGYKKDSLGRPIRGTSPTLKWVCGLAYVLCLVLVVIAVLSCLKGLADHGKEEAHESNSPGVSTGTPTATPTINPPGSATTCPVDSWTMVGGKPVNGVWFQVPSIRSAHTSRQAINAFYDWYKQAVNRTDLVRQLAGALYTTYPAGLADHKCASESMIAFGKRLNTTLNHSVYYPEGSSIRVVAPGGVEFRVMADTGQLHELH